RHRGLDEREFRLIQVDAWRRWLRGICEGVAHECDRRDTHGRHERRLEHATAIGGELHAAYRIAAAHCGPFVITTRRVRIARRSCCRDMQTSRLLHRIGKMPALYSIDTPAAHARTGVEDGRL